MTAPLPVWWLPAPPLHVESLLAAAGGDVACALDGARGEWAIGVGAARESAAFDLAQLARDVAAQPVRGLGSAVSHGGALWIGAGVFDSARPGGGAWGPGPAARWILPRVAFVGRGAEARCAVAGASDESQALRGRNSALAQLNRAAAAAGGAALARGAAHSGALHMERCESAESFCARVAAATSAIAEGALQKVVLARACRIRAAEPVHAGRLLHRLCAAEPDSFLFAIPLLQPGAVLLGASPERLVRVAGGCVAVDALAGSAARAAAPGADAAAARALCESKKDQAEHAWVRLFVAQALAQSVREPRAPEAPGILSTARIHHLHTPFHAHRLAPFGLLELAARLHPSPAIAGVPAEAALRWLRENEPLARGAYAGPVGWLGRDGEGSLAVALRCAHVRGRSATVFAGAGIVADSEPRAEFEETQLKLRVLLDALGAPA